MEEKTKIGFLEETPGQKSMMRLAVGALLICAIVGGLTLLAVGMWKYLQPGSAEKLEAIALASGGFITSISAAALTFKSIQKSTEEKIP